MRTLTHSTPTVEGGASHVDCPQGSRGGRCFLPGSLEQEAWLRMKSQLRDTHTWSHAQGLCPLEKAP